MSDEQDEAAIVKENIQRLSGRTEIIDVMTAAAQAAGAPEMDLIAHLADALLLAGYRRARS